MAVLQMQRISMCALNKNRKQILELLQRRGVIEINDETAEDSIFRKSNVSNTRSLFEKNINTAIDALETLNIYVNEDKSMFGALNGRKEVSSKFYDDFYPEHDKVARIANKIVSLQKSIVENKAEIIKLEAQIEILKPWVSLDIPVNYTGTKHTAVFIGTLQNEWSQDAIYEKSAEYLPIDVDVISSSKEQTCIFVMCMKEKSDEVFESLRSIGFSRPSTGSSKPPASRQEDLQLQVEAAKKVILLAEEEILSYKEHKDELRFFIDYDTMRNEKYDVINHLLQSKNVFILTGYIPQQEVDSLTQLLNQRFDLAIEVESVSAKEDAPILLQNNGFSSPLESTVESYSPPGKGEIDPTMVMSLFYYLLFGLMLSDAAYGAIIAIACGVILIKFKNLDDSMKKTMKMYFFCGMFTIFWGIMFGSYFGDVVDVVSQTFFGHKITIPALWFYPVNEPMRMLSFSMLLGVIHLFAGLGMKMYQLFKQKLYIDVFYDVISWYVLLISCILLLLSNSLFTNILGITFILPSNIGSIAGILAILSSIVIILTNGRESRNPFKRFLKGLYAFYGISGYLSDVLSYSRLLALGLATGVIATVINKMGSMAGDGVLGAIVFVLVFIFGHALNLAINALGAYVHTNRLQYVEFFGKFYEGGGRKFNPFSIKTKYYKFKEKTDDE